MLQTYIKLLKSLVNEHSSQWLGVLPKIDSNCCCLITRSLCLLSYQIFVIVPCCPIRVLFWNQVITSSMVTLIVLLQRILRSFFKILLGLFVLLLNADFWCLSIPFQYVWVIHKYHWQCDLLAHVLCQVAWYISPWYRPESYFFCSSTMSALKLSICSL